MDGPIYLDLVKRAAGSGYTVAEVYYGKFVVYNAPGPDDNGSTKRVAVF